MLKKKKDKRKSQNSKILLLSGFILLLLITLAYFLYTMKKQNKIVSMIPIPTSQPKTLNEIISYNIPTDWKIVKEEENYLKIESPDYQTGPGGGISMGAQIFITTAINAHSLDEAIEEDQAPSQTEPINLKVDNKQAVSFTGCGDSCRIITYILLGDKVLGVGYLSNPENLNGGSLYNMNKTIHYSEYQQFIDTLKFK